MRQDVEDSGIEPVPAAIDTFCSTIPRSKVKVRPTKVEPKLSSRKKRSRFQRISPNYKSPGRLLSSPTMSLSARSFKSNLSN